MKKNMFKKAAEKFKKTVKFVKDHRHEIEYFISEQHTTEHDETTDTNSNSGINVSAEL